MTACRPSRAARLKRPGASSTAAKPYAYPSNRPSFGGFRGRRVALPKPRTSALSRVSPKSASTMGVGTPTAAPIPRTAPTSASS
jgi:hypothetical protein